MERGSHRGFPGNPGPRPPYTGDWHHRRQYVSPYGAGYHYGIPGYGWVSPYFLGNPDYGYDDASNQPAAPAEGDAGEPEDQDQVRQQANPLPPYQPNPDFSRPAPAPVEEEAVTLIFKDGRPSEQIHNYLLTATTLFVVDQHQRAIPTDQLDLVATARVNQDAGVDFQLPNSVK